MLNTAKIFKNHFKKYFKILNILKLGQNIDWSNFLFYSQFNVNSLEAHRVIPVPMETTLSH